MEEVEINEKKSKKYRPVLNSIIKIMKEKKGIEQFYNKENNFNGTYKKAKPVNSQ